MLSSINRRRKNIGRFIVDLFLYFMQVSSSRFKHKFHTSMLGSVPSRRFMDKLKAAHTPKLSVDIWQSTFLRHHFCESTGHCQICVTKHISFDQERSSIRIRAFCYIRPLAHDLDEDIISGLNTRTFRITSNIKHICSFLPLPSHCFCYSSEQYQAAILINVKVVVNVDIDRVRMSSNER